MKQRHHRFLHFLFNFLRFLWPLVIFFPLFLAFPTSINQDYVLLLSLLSPSFPTLLSLFLTGWKMATSPRGHGVAARRQRRWRRSERSP